MNNTKTILFSLACLGPAAGAAAADLCQGLVQDKQSRPTSPLAKPAVGQAVVEPQFGTTLRRITAVGASTSGGDAAIVPLYSTVSAWNADESLLVLYQVGRGHLLYDGRSYRFLRALDIAPNDLEQVYWSTSDPDVLLYLSGTSLVRYHVASARKETVRTFEFCSAPVSGGSDPMFTSWDSGTIGLRCGSTAFGYQVGTNTVTGRATSSSANAPQAAPSGTRMLFDGVVLDTALRSQRRLDLANPFDHASLGRYNDGHDALNTVAFDPGPAGSGVGSLVTFDLGSGASRVIVGPATGWPYPPSGTHVSSLVYRDPGWTYVSIVGNPSGAGVLDNEVLLADTNSGRVCRVAHHRSWGGNNTHLQQPYWAEPHVVASPTGTRAIFASDWGNGSTVDTYVVELARVPALTFSVFTDKLVYRTGQTMTASGASTNPGLTGTVDLFAFLVLPDGDRVMAWTPQGLKSGQLSKPTSLTPASAGLDLRTPWQTSGPFFRFTWTGTETAGKYFWVLVAVRSGSLADNRFDPGDVVASATSSFTFTR